MGLKAFFDDLAGDSGKLKLLGLGPNQTAEFQALAQAAESDLAKRTWITAMPANEDHRILLEQIGVKVSAYRDGTIGRPKAMRWVGDEIWVGSYDRIITRFDANWSYLGDFGYPGNPSINPRAFDRLNDFAVDAGAGRLYLVSGYNRVQALDLATMEHLWTWGDGYAGNFAGNRPANPISCEVLANGNLAVAVPQGQGQIGGVTGIPYGYIAELDGATGAPVACRLMCKTGGAPWRGEVRSPNRIRLLDGRVYISYDTHDVVGVFDSNTWDYLESFTRPTGIDAKSITPRGLCLNDAGDQLVIAAGAPNLLVSLGLADHDYKWHVGVPQWDDRAEANMVAGELWNIWDVLPLGSGLYAVAETGNARIHVLPEYGQVEVPYAVTVPAGWEVEKSPLDAAGNLKVPLNQLGTVGEIVLPLKRI